MGDRPGHEFHGNQWTAGHQAALTQHLTREDRIRFDRESKKYGHGNPYAIGLELKAADEMKAEIDKGKDPSKAFSDNFTPTASNHRVAKKLGLNLDVERGQWVEKPFVDKKAAAAAEREQRIAEFHSQNGSLDFAKEEAKAAAMSDMELAYARLDAHKAAEAMGNSNPRQGFYRDQGSVYQREQAKREVATQKLEAQGMSRSDAQAVHEAEQIKTRIRGQLGVTPEQHAQMQAAHTGLNHDGTLSSGESPEARIAAGRPRPGDVRQAGQRVAATVGHANYLKNLKKRG